MRSESGNVDSKISSSQKQQHQPPPQLHHHHHQQQQQQPPPQLQNPTDPNNNDENYSNQKQVRERSRAVLSATIAWVESLKVPSRLLRGNGATATTSNNNHNNTGDVAIIAGLERVVFGTQPACEVVTIVGVHPPRYLCYMLSGFLCDIIQFFIDVLLHVVFLLEDASVCWALGFGLSVAFRHSSHRYLVFGDYVGGYWQSLGRMYAGYSIIIVISTIFNLFMTRYAKFPHYVAWVITLLWTGIVNYFILKRLWSFGGKEKMDKETDIEMEEPLLLTDLELQETTTTTTTTTTTVSRKEGGLQARKVDGKR